MVTNNRSNLHGIELANLLLRSSIIRISHALLELSQIEFQKSNNAQVDARDVVVDKMKKYFFKDTDALS